MKSDYVQAVIALIEAGNDPHTVVTGLVRTLKAHGHERLQKAILIEVERTLTQTASKNVPQITVATKADLDAQKKAIDATLYALDITEEPVVQIDESIIGGHSLEYKHQRVDKTYKTILTNLYRTITR